MPEMRVYPLTGYPEEIISVAFAKASRSPKPFDEMVKETSDETSRKFHEKWVLAYGHSSVAEHAVLHLAAENVSRLAIESIEENRLGSYTEKSTRYQVLDKEHSHIPEEIKGSPLERTFSSARDTLFSAYSESLETLKEHFRSAIEKRQGESDKAYELRLKLEALDNARFLLPNATLANVGITMNARELRHAAVKMLSHPLAEVRALGKKISESGVGVTPTLLEGVSENPGINAIRDGLRGAFSSLSGNAEKKVSLIKYPGDAVERLCAALTYRWSGIPFSKAFEGAKALPPEEKKKIIEKVVSQFPKGTGPTREFEHVYYTFDLVMDQGAYYEFKRHRMLTISPQEITVALGHRLPEAFEKAGTGKNFEDAMKASAEAFSAIKEEHPFAAPYIATNAHYRRVLATLNLRELRHFVKIRSAPFAHQTIRELALEMQEEVRKVHPEFSLFLNFGGRK